MAELINLRQFKKRKNRRIKDDAAERNRAKFGRAKADRKAAGAEADKLRRDLDGKKRED